jgi:ABC-type dipeptide/oligopeptide/nickel transport system permease component
VLAVVVIGLAMFILLGIPLGTWMLFARNRRMEKVALEKRRG